MAKRAVCISCYNFYDHRVELVLDQLRLKGYQCTYITGDYNHFTRERYHIDYPDSVQVHTVLYRRNVSLARIYSHIRFARDVFRRVEQIDPDFLYVMVPPNSLSRWAAAYKRRHPRVKLALDLYDLWPETFPSETAKRLAALPFRLWGKMRDSGLAAADRIYPECDLFRQVLGDRLAGKDVRILPLCREAVTAQPAPQAPEGEELALCYLGNIGKLADIDAMEALIRQMAALRPVTVHVVGTGETQEQLIAAIERAGARAQHHGIVYDPAQRQRIFDRCHFGLNIMKTSVVVGLTMKSLDYFAGALPILNTIAGDTRQMIARYDAGIEVDREHPEETARQAALMSPERNTAMRQNALRLFEENYSLRRVRQILEDLE